MVGSRITSSGQATIPKIIQDRLVLEPGERVLFIEKNGEIVLQPVKHTLRDLNLGILNTPGLRVEQAELLARAVHSYVNENIDFVDACSGLWMQEQGIFSAVTFNNKHFLRIPEIITRMPDNIE